MQVFQSSMNTVLKSLLRLGELHCSLFELANLKIINCEQLSQSPYIADELALARADLQPLKDEIEVVSQRAKQAIDSSPSFPAFRQQQEALLSRMVTRVLEAISSHCEQEIEYYQYYNERFRVKCRRILREMGQWEVFEVARVLYKYFRHVVLIELERYEEVLECMAQTDFESVKYLREYFYSVLQKKESKQREAKLEAQKGEKAEKVVSGNKSQPHPQANSQDFSSSPFIPAPTTSLLQQTQKAFQTYSQKQIHPSSTEADNFQDHAQKQASERKAESAHPLPPPVPPQAQGKGKSNIKSTKKLFSMLSSVMDIKREHFVSEIPDKRWEERSLYSDLIGRNKINHSQISAYYHYSQLMPDRLNSTEGFYYYQEEAELIDDFQEQLSADQKRVKVHIPAEQQKKLLTCEPARKQPSPQLSTPFEKRKQHRTVHKSINCRPRGEHPNAEIEQRPVKIDSQFLEINLRKVLPTRRQSQMEKLVIKASSLNNLRHDLHHKRIQLATDNAVKASSELFKSVKILHQGEMDPKQQAKALREVKERAERPHASRINSWINEELRQNQYCSGRPEEVRRRMAFQKDL